MKNLKNYIETELFKNLLLYRLYYDNSNFTFLGEVNDYIVDNFVIRYQVYVPEYLHLFPEICRIAFSGLILNYTDSPTLNFNVK
jgi:hypothetical protein